MRGRYAPCTGAAGRSARDAIPGGPLRIQERGDRHGRPRHPEDDGELIGEDREALADLDAMAKAAKNDPAVCDKIKMEYEDKGWL